MLSLVFDVFGHGGIVGKGFHEDFWRRTGGLDIFGGSFIFFEAARKDPPRDRKNTFDPWPVNTFDLAGLGDGDVFWRFGRYLTLGGHRGAVFEFVGWVAA